MRIREELLEVLKEKIRNRFIEVNEWSRDSIWLPSPVRVQLHLVMCSSETNQARLCVFLKPGFTAGVVRAEH